MAIWGVLMPLYCLYTSQGIALEGRVGSDTETVEGGLMDTVIKIQIMERGQTPKHQLRSGQLNIPIGLRDL